MNKRAWLLAVATGLILLAGCRNTIPPATSAMLPEPPAAPREFRAAWIATVGNIDWPTKPGLSTEVQQREAIAILDRLHELNMNAAILQVRTSADALYDSKLEPWSYYLTGVQGKAPEPYYDPLKFWIDEAHKRGIELHAWFNPFRAQPGGAKYPLAANHIANTHPSAVHRYGTMLWMDPAEPEAHKQSLAVFLDVVKRYDVDGVHIDDYFYPYPENGPDHKPLPFPDNAAWNRYQSAGGKLARDDWRRDAITRMIHDIYLGTKAEKPWVKFGISPFGLPYGSTMPDGIKGFNQFEKLYADTILWLQKGWVDYWTPQLYWSSEQRPQSYPILLDYWLAANTFHRHIWPGLYTSRVGHGEGTPWRYEEILNQIKLTRWRPDATGTVHFSMKSLMPQFGSFGDVLRKDVYSEPALVPSSPWLGTQKPARPTLKLTAEQTSLHLSWSCKNRTTLWQYALWIRNGETWHFHVLPFDQTSLTIEDNISLGGPITEVVLSTVDRLGNESDRVKAGRPYAMKYPWPGLTTRPSTK